MSENTFYDTTDCKELDQYMRKIAVDSETLINKIIAKYSPVKIGEDIKEIPSGRMIRIKKIDLLVVDSWGYPGDKLSFSYEGDLLTKKNKIMKNRNRVKVCAFQKNGKKYFTPSYNRIKIEVARMFQTWR